MRAIVRRTLALALLACGGGGGGEAPSPEARCAEVSCSGHGVCAVENDAAVCHCADGFTAIGLACDPVPEVAGACSFTVAAGGTNGLVCVSYTGSSWTVRSAQEACGRFSYMQYSAQCSTAGITGRCRVGGGTAEEIVSSFYSGTAAEVSEACAAMSGVIVP